MNMYTPSNALGPAAEKAERMEAGLVSLQAGLAEVFAGFPLLLNLLMRLFALLRAAAERLAANDVAPLVENVAAAQLPAVKPAVRSVGKRRATCKARRVVRAASPTRVRVGRRVDMLEPAKRSGQICCAPPPFRRRRSKSHLCAAKTHAHFVTIS